MSSRLQIIANHAITFQKLSLPEVGAKVCKQLNDQLQLPNGSFVASESANSNDEATIQKQWDFVISKSVLYGGLDESDYLLVKSGWHIDLIVEEGYLVLLPPIHKTKHYQWFNFDPKTCSFPDVDAYRMYQNEWSKAMLAIVEALGGHTIYILADMDYDHNYKTSDTFDVIEQTIYSKCGPAKTRYEDMEYDPDEDESIPYLKITKDTVNQYVRVVE